jgi:hypothetical protein
VVEQVRYCFRLDVSGCLHHCNGACPDAGKISQWVCKDGSSITDQVATIEHLSVLSDYLRSKGEHVLVAEREQGVKRKEKEKEK